MTTSTLQHGGACRARHRLSTLAGIAGSSAARIQQQRTCDEACASLTFATENKPAPRKLSSMPVTDDRVGTKSRKMRAAMIVAAIGMAVGGRKQRMVTMTACSTFCMPKQADFKTRADACATGTARTCDVFGVARDAGGQGAVGRRAQEHDVRHEEAHAARRPHLQRDAYSAHSAHGRSSCKAERRKRAARCCRPAITAAGIAAPAASAIATHREPEAGVVAVRERLNGERVLELAGEHGADEAQRQRHQRVVHHDAEALHSNRHPDTRHMHAGA